MPSASTTLHYSSLPSTSTPTGPYFLSRARTTARAISATLRPWEELFALYSCTLPYTLEAASSRVKRNLNHFHVNYALVFLVILFLNLLWYPLSMIVFLTVFITWFFLYFFRYEPVAVFDCVIDDRLILGVLGVVTIVALLLTGVWLNVLVSVLVGAAFIGLHATFRSTDDLYVDEQEAADGALHSVVGSPRRTGHTRI